MSTQMKMDRGIADLLSILLHTYGKENLTKFWNTVISSRVIDYQKKWNLDWSDLRPCSIFYQSHVAWKPQD